MDRAASWLPIGFFAGAALVAVPHWTAGPQDDITEPMYLLALAGVAMIAMMLTVARAASGRRTLAVMASALPAVFALRIVMDTAADPTSHNLWPLEMIFGAVVSLAIILPGVLVGKLLRRFTRA